MKHQTTKQVIARIAIIISIVELSFMLILERSTLLHSIDERIIAPLNVFVLIGISAPLIYLLVIKPFIIARDEALEQLRHLAFTDPLTQLPNRRPLLMNIEKFLDNCKRHNDRGALLLIDLDRFKQINDMYGHDAGDSALIEFSRRLKSKTRSGELVGRFGGDEFLILLDHLDVDEAITRERVSALCAKLIEMVKVPFQYQGNELNLGISIGVRLLGFDDLDKETAISDADTAMYKAKAEGKSCMIFFKE